MYAVSVEGFPETVCDANTIKDFLSGLGY